MKRVSLSRAAAWTLCIATLAAPLTAPQAQQQQQPTLRLPTVALATGAHYKLVRANDVTYRIDTRSGEVGMFMMSGSYSWHKMLDNAAPAAAAAPGSFDLIEVSGKSVIRMDLRTGTTWMVVAKQGLPELQKVVN
jgi:hypothetical protein